MSTETKKKSAAVGWKLMFAQTPAASAATSPATARRGSLYVPIDHGTKKIAMKKKAPRSSTASPPIAMTVQSDAMTASGATKGRSRVKRSATAPTTETTTSQPDAPSSVRLSTTMAIASVDATR